MQKWVVCVLIKNERCGAWIHFAPTKNNGETSTNPPSDQSAADRKVHNVRSVTTPIAYSHG